MKVVLLVLLAFVLSALAVAMLARYRGRWQALDSAGSRSLHQGAIPRSGGIGIMLAAGASTLAGVVAGAWQLPVALGLALAPVFLVSLIDDFRGVPATVRLLVHLAAAAVLLAMSGVMQETSLFGSCLLLLVIAWMTNLFNFMDGMDGLAGSMACWGFLGQAALAGIAGDVPLMGLCLVLVAANGGFLLSNLPPARIFMGDAGSGSLGFLAAGIAVLLWQRDTVSLAVALFPFLPFVVDATCTLLRRLFAGANVFRPHREHLYQRMVLGGYARTRVLGAANVLMILCLLNAILLSLNEKLAPLGVSLGVWVVAYLLLSARSAASGTEGIE